MILANKFETEIKSSFTKLPAQPGYPDILAGLPFVYHKLVVNKQSGYGVDSPCDALVDCIGFPNLALELKEFATRSSFPFNRIEDHQLEGLLRYHYTGRRSFLLICFRKWQLSVKEKTSLTPAQIKILEERRAYALSIKDFLFLRGKSLQEDRKSVSIEDIVSYSRRLPLIRLASGELGWDIQPLLQ